MKLASWTGRTHHPPIVTSKPRNGHRDGFIQTGGGYVYSVLDSVDECTRFASYSPQYAESLTGSFASCRERLLPAAVNAFGVG